MARLARELQWRGFEVCVVTCDFGQPAFESVDGIAVYRAFARSAGAPILRFFHPRLTGAARALSRADAEVYYVIGAGFPAGITHDVSRLRRAGFVLHMMSDYDVDPKLPFHQARDRWWHRRALRGADAVFAQTEFQREALRVHFGVSSVRVPNLIAIPADPADPGQDGMVLWHGTYKAIKRPELFIELARRLPQYRFLMVGFQPPPPLTDEHWQAARRAAGALPNLEVRGFQPADELDRLRRRASLLVHTSPLEGFSNVLLEAWALGLPTVSGVNPDGIVTGRGLGACFTDLPTLVAAVDTLMRDPGGRREAGTRARRYATETHAPAVVLDGLTAVLDQVVACVRRHRSGIR